MPFLLVAALAMAPQVVEGPVRVVDGDTLRMGEHRIRLHGIDAPESRQNCTTGKDMAWMCGQAATTALRDKIGTASVRCEVEDQDRYRRLVARCFVGSVDVNGWMVAQGWALAYRQYSLRYIGLEDQARLQKRGIWAAQFTPPWQWRAARRHRAAQ